MLKQAGFGDVAYGDTLWLASAGEHGKDRRRWAISQQYCVIAQVGDQLGDFTDLFNATTPDVADRRATVSGKTVERRSEEHKSELQSLMRISYAVFCLKKKKTKSSTNN